jgi:IS1 family transposase
VSEWAAKFGLKFACQRRRRARGRFADKWQLDEMVVTIKGKKYWLWRAVDANGYVLDALLQSRRNRAAALRLMRKLLKGQGTIPRVIVTDKLRSYSAAKAELMPGVEHRSHTRNACHPRDITNNCSGLCLEELFAFDLHVDIAKAQFGPTERFWVKVTTCCISAITSIAANILAMSPCTCKVLVGGRVFCRSPLSL